MLSANEIDRDWKSALKIHYDSFNALLYLTEEFCDYIDERLDDQNHDHQQIQLDIQLLYRMASRLIIDLATDDEHLREITITFRLLCELEKQAILIDQIVVFHAKIMQTSNSLQAQFVKTDDINTIRSLPLPELWEYLHIQLIKHMINANLAKAYASKLKLNESLKAIQVTIKQSNKFNECVKTYNNKLLQASSASQLHPMSHRNLAEFYSFESKVFLRMNDFEKSLDSINKAIESTFAHYQVQKPSASELDHFEEDKDSDLSEEERMTKYIETECFEYYIERGLAYSNMGNHLKSYENDYKATQINPKSVEAWNNRAFSLYGLRKYTECIRDCNFVLKTLNPEGFNRGLLIGNRGLAEYELKRFNVSIDDLNECITLCPQSRLARETLKKIWDEIVQSIYCAATLLVNVPFEIAVIISNYGVGIDFDILESCNTESNIVYLDISDF